MLLWDINITLVENKISYCIVHWQHMLIITVSYYLSIHQQHMLIIIATYSNCVRVEFNSEKFN